MAPTELMDATQILAELEPGVDLEEQYPRVVEMVHAQASSSSGSADVAAAAHVRRQH